MMNHTHSHHSDTPAKTETIRVIADLPLGTLEILRELACSQHISLTEAIRRSIATAGLLQRYRQNNNRILIENTNGDVSEFVLRQ